MDATLREITGLVKEVNPDARSKGTYFDFSLVTPEPRTPGYRMREVGVTCSGQKGADDSKTLAQARLVNHSNIHRKKLLFLLRWMSVLLHHRT